MVKVLMKGNEAIGEAAIRAGCIHFFGYPITPQSEVPEYLSKRLPEVGGKYVQAESEVAASNMIFGAAAVGTRVLTTSSSPGISLMSEAFSYLAACELPVVVVNIMRCGPGLGGILPGQSDYTQATKGLAHGDFDFIVLAPASVQEAVNLIILAFQLAEKYRNPAMVIGDGMIGQMMEPVEFPEVAVGPPMDSDNWALTGCRDRKRRIISSLYLDPDQLHAHNLHLRSKFDRVRQNEIRYETYNCDGPVKLLLVAFGMMARICKTAIDELKEAGIEVGLFRPIIVHPFPYDACHQTIVQATRVLTVEMNMGQMVEDVKLAANGCKPIDFYGKTGGLIPSVQDIVTQARQTIDAGN